MIGLEIWGNRCWTYREDPDLSHRFTTSYQSSLTELVNNVLVVSESSYEPISFVSMSTLASKAMRDGKIGLSIYRWNYRYGFGYVKYNRHKALSNFGYDTEISPRMGFSRWIAEMIKEFNGDFCESESDDIRTVLQQRKSYIRKRLKHGSV